MFEYSIFKSLLAAFIHKLVCRRKVTRISQLQAHSSIVTHTVIPKSY